ncbi:UMP-CMP kinase [Schistosoma japonicum]|nr:UMP-CMP kinase [Schistosoma japonicum]
MRLLRTSQVVIILVDFSDLLYSCSVCLASVIQLGSDAMKKNYENAKCTNFLVDGFPRNDDNRLCWEEDLSTSTVLKRVIVLECPDDVCVQRCLGRHSNRIDDNEETLKLRIKQFKEQCMPVIQFYEKQNLVTRIDANKSIPEVYEQVRQMMQTLNFNCK